MGIEVNLSGFNYAKGEIGTSANGAKFATSPYLDKYPENERAAIESSLNEVNYQFLDELTAYDNNLMDGFTWSGIKMVLDCITEENLENATTYTNELMVNPDYQVLAYQLVEDITGEKVTYDYDNDFDLDVNISEEQEGYSPIEMDEYEHRFSELEQGEYPPTDASDFFAEMASFVQNRTEYISDLSKDDFAKLSVTYSMFANELYLEPSTNPEVIEIEDMMADMGVRVTFCDNLETARATYEACKQVQERGGQLPKEIVMADLHEGINGVTTTMASGNEENSAIFIALDLGQRTFEDTQIEPVPNETLDYSNVDSAIEVVIHELGHYNHNLNVANTMGTLDYQFSEVIPDDMCWWVAKEVSFYALESNSLQEVGAEIFAGLMRGEEYSDYVMDIYKKIGGFIPESIK